MNQGEWERALESWRYQELAQFARRAHRQLGRGFVLVDGSDPQPVYVTQVLGAPQPLIDAVYAYDPHKEALVVREDEVDDDCVTISRITIEAAH